MNQVALTSSIKSSGMQKHLNCARTRQWGTSWTTNLHAIQGAIILHGHCTKVTCWNWRQKSWLSMWVLWMIPYSGNFQGRKLSRISRFCGYSLKFFRKILGSGVLGATQASNPRNFSAKIVFFTNSRKFSPSKVSRYMVYTHPLFLPLNPIKQKWWS